ncbi:phosphotransferase [Microlunatus soli]|uniref:phosphotransferase n=1 Tax=Microlunatus soli TaxID=630515 RepID=UPI0015607EAC|nr:phosphotransferase [Microlunatus soli]
MIINDRRKSLSEWGKQDSGCYPELIESPTARYFSRAERSWISSIDTALIDYLAGNYPEPRSLTFAVLHGDLAFEQVRLLPDGEVYFFDFGDLSWGPVAHELAQFLRGFAAEPIPRQRWLDLKAGLLAGYRSEHSLSVADEDAIEVFLLNRVLAVARYVLELHGNSAAPGGAEVIKQGYRLAAEILHGPHQPQQI